MSVVALLAIVFAVTSAFTSKQVTFTNGDYFLVDPAQPLAVQYSGSWDARYASGVLADFDAQSRDVSEVDQLTFPSTGVCDGFNTDEVCAIEIPSFLSSIDEQFGGTSAVGVMNQEELDQAKSLTITTFFYKNI